MEWLGVLAAIIAIILIAMEKNGNDSRTPYTIEPTGDSTIYKVINEQGGIETYGTYQQCEEWIRNH